MSEEKKFKLSSLKETLLTMLGKVQRYSLILFLLFVGVLYAVIVMQINSLSNAQPSTTDVDSQVNAAKIPHIDPTVVSQLKSLQDNSVSVQTLFNQARDNPFQE